MALMTTVYRPYYPYQYPYGVPGGTTVERPIYTVPKILGAPVVKTVSPAVAAVTPAITINRPAPHVLVTPVQSGAPADVAAQEGWLDQSAIGGISNKVLVGLAVVAGLVYFSSKK